MAVTMRNILMACILALVRTSAAPGQTEPEERLTEDGQSLPFLVERLDEWRMHPLDLNCADPEDLAGLPLLDGREIRKITGERKKRPFLSWQDLMARADLDSVRLAGIRALVTFGGENTSNRAQMLRVRLRRVQETPPGDTGSHRGSPVKIYGRTEASLPGLVKAAWIFEKDPGEENWDDHEAGFAEWTGRSGKIRLLAGCFHAGSGQGLVFGGGSLFGSSNDPSAAVRNKSRCIRGYASSDESRYLAGVASEIRLPGADLAVLFSRRRLDAALNPDGSARSLKQDGLHRSSQECSARNKLREDLAGITVRLSRNCGEIGFSGWINRYDRPFHGPDASGEPFRFSGMKNGTAGAHGLFRIRGLSVSGEAARSRSGGIAWILLLSMDSETLPCIFSYRDYGPGFLNPLAGGFGSGETRNERGWHAGLRFRIGRRSRVCLSMDQETRPWPTARIPFASAARDLILEMESGWRTGIDCSARLRFRQWESTAAATGMIGQAVQCLADRLQESIRIEASFSAVPGIVLKTRIEFNRTGMPAVLMPARHAEKQDGFLMLQEFSWCPSKSVAAVVRYSFFDAESWDARLYAWEKDLPGAWSVQVFNGRGSRCAAYFEWKPSSRFSLSVKVAGLSGKGGGAYAAAPESDGADTRKTIGIQAECSL